MKLPVKLIKVRGLLLQQQWRLTSKRDTRVPALLLEL